MRYYQSTTNISIHAPREGGDSAGAGPDMGGPAISIHAPREGGDLTRSEIKTRSEDFNPRPPRGGRRPKMPIAPPRSNFNPRPPRGGRPSGTAHLTEVRDISIHAPREGGDLGFPTMRVGNRTFQSTPPARGATAPCRQETLLSSFQSTPPARGATYIKATVEIPFPISIHAPCEGGDCERCGADIVSVRFQSTPPARGATSDGLFVLFSFLISIHAPREGGDQGHRISSTASRCISIHAPREGGDMVRFHSPQPI